MPTWGAGIIAELGADIADSIPDGKEGHLEGNPSGLSILVATYPDRLAGPMDGRIPLK